MEKTPVSGAEQAALGLAKTQQALLHFRKGYFPRAIQRLEESLCILRPLEDAHVLTDGLVYLGIIKHLEGDMPGSRKLFEEGLRCAQLGRDDWFAAYATYNLGYVDGLEGNYEEAYQLMQGAMKTWERLGDPHSLSLGLNYLTPTRIQLGLYDEAQEVLEESLRLCKETGNRWGMGTAYRCLGMVLVAKGQYPEAEQLFRKSLETFGDYTEGWDIASSYINLGNAIRLTGYPAKAKTIYQDAMRMALEIGAPPVILDVLVRMAELEVQEGRAARAWEVVNLVIPNPGVTHEIKVRAQGILKNAERILDAEEVDCLRETAKPLSVNEIAERFLTS